MARTMGVVETSADAVERQVSIAKRVCALVRARALSPAEQVRVLMTAAASVIVTHSCGRGRELALVRAVGELTGSVAGAAAAADQALERMVVEGSA